MNNIRFEGVTKTYSDQVVIDDLNLEVGPAEMLIILGGSGSGKSTLLKMVLGLVKPDTGTVFVGGLNVGEMAEEKLLQFRSRMGMVFQSGALFDSLTVGENVAYRLRDQSRLDESEIIQEVQQLLGFVGLGKAIDKLPSELSGGMRRRVAIARAMVGQPQIMLYDEPTAGLDPITGRTICELVMKLRDLEHVTSIFVTHDLHAAMTLAREIAQQDDAGRAVFQDLPQGKVTKTRFVILEGGRILLEGTDEDLRNSDNPYIREFLD